MSDPIAVEGGAINLPQAYAVFEVTPEGVMSNTGFVALTLAQAVTYAKANTGGLWLVFKTTYQGPLFASFDWRIGDYTRPQ